MCQQLAIANVKATSLEINSIVSMCGLHTKVLVHTKRLRLRLQTVSEMGSSKSME